MSKAIIIPGADFSENKLTTVGFGTVPCTGISLSDVTKTFSAIGSTETLIATLTPENTTDTLAWSSSDTSIVSVVDGVITAVGCGNAVITATCGEQTASCSVAVEVVPDFVAVGGFNARLGGGGVYNENVTQSSSEGKNGIIVANNADTNLKTWDRSGGGTQEGDFRFVPIMIPNGAKRIKLKSKVYRNNTLVGFKTRFLFCDSTQSPSGYVGVKCVDGKGVNNYDQDNYVTEYTIDIPTITGLDSFGIDVYLNDYALVWNVDKSNEFEVTILGAAT